jgi:hypothetical protein
MRCPEAQELITGLVDNELTAEERRSIDAHLKDCRSCQLIHRHEIALKRQTRSAGASLSVPTELRETLMARARHSAQASSTATAGWRPDHWLSIPPLKLVVAAAALMILIAPLLYFRRPPQSVSWSALEAHQKILAGEMIFFRAQNSAELQKQMLHAVGGRFAPMGYDLSALKLRPANGGVQEFAGRQVLVTVYRGDGPEITCFTFLGTEEDAPRDAEIFFDGKKKMNFYSFSRDGVRAVLHREGEIICIFTSKMPMAELLAMVRAKARPA